MFGYGNKDYKIRTYAVAKSYEERYQRLVSVVNVIIDEFHNDLLNIGNTEIETKIEKKIIQLRKKFLYCQNSYNTNHRDLNNLAFELKNYIFYILTIYNNEFYKNSPRIEFSYNAKNWMILLKYEDEDKIVEWYLGRND
tara:strand:- start:99 stop:515 length:417 start_codon:yes stop_codon:yes gene_type:complete